MSRWNDLPFVIDGPDDEAQGWAHSVYIFVHQPLDDGSLPSIIQSSTVLLALNITDRVSPNAHSIRILISLSFNRAFRRIESILAVDSFRVGEVNGRGISWLASLFFAIQKHPCHLKTMAQNRQFPPVLSANKDA